MIRRKLCKMVHPSELVGDNRGVSFTIEYIITLSALVALLMTMTGVLITGAGDAQDDVTQYELERISTEVVTELVEVDRMANQGGNTPSTNSFSTRIHVDLLQTIGERSYILWIEGDSTLVVRSQQDSHRVEIPIDREISIQGGAVTGDLWIQYDSESGNEIHITKG